MRNNKGNIIVGICAENKILSITKEMIIEQLIFYNALTNQEEKPKDWFRKFDNKKRWQK